MSGVVVVGSQWGDEGKGKIVDWLSVRADVIVRFQGGHNAGHTLVLNNQVYKLNLVPSGVVRKNKLSIIGNGVVINPWQLREEITHLCGQGLDINPNNLKIADNACLILPIHWELDALREGLQDSIGTTKRGIGPAYEDKVGRRNIRVADLFDRNGLVDKIKIIAKYHDMLRSAIGLGPVNQAQLLEELLAIVDFIKPYSCILWKVLEEQYYQNKRVLFEGAQGIMLDLDHGSYPFVTSSNSVPYHAITGSGFGKNRINFVLGITKAYTTRVGSGPFPTEQDNEIGHKLRLHGQEVGTNTSRFRRCGWFDAVQVRQAVKVAGIDGLALTKLDILDKFPEIKICTAYKLRGKNIDYFPASLADQKAIVPIYETWPGWCSVTHGSRSWIDLPLEANRYLRRIEELTESNITLLSTSPDRDDTICNKDIF